MSFLDQMFDSFTSAVPMAITAVIVIIVIVVARYLLTRQAGVRTARKFRVQLTTMLLSLLGLVSLIVASPLGDTSKGQLLSLIGILLSAAIALSSTTLLGNAMAGVMLRAIRSFRAGDFLSVRDNFGRVTELGLFHTEIQAEDSNLVTLPNLHLVTNPVKVLRSSGTIISADVSGNIRSWNRAATTLFGYEPEEVLGRPLELIIPEDAFGPDNRIMFYPPQPKRMSYLLGGSEDFVQGMDAILKDLPPIGERSNEQVHMACVEVTDEEQFPATPSAPYSMQCREGGADERRIQGFYTTESHPLREGLNWNALRYQPTSH